MGYGEGDENKVVSYGAELTINITTPIFEKQFLFGYRYLKNAQINLLCDDWAVIYINGIEAARYNMPTGTITYTTLASSAATENLYVSYSINPKLLVPGR